MRRQKDVRKILDSQAKIDALLVKTSVDIILLREQKKKKYATIKILDTKLTINYEIETLRNTGNKTDSNFSSFKFAVCVKELST